MYVLMNNQTLSCVTTDEIITITNIIPLLIELLEKANDVKTKTKYIYINYTVNIVLGLTQFITNIRIWIAYSQKDAFVALINKERLTVRI